MIVAHYGDEQSDCLLFILEPANIAKIQLGQPIIKKLRDFLPGITPDTQIAITYSPDVLWVCQQMKAGKSLTDALEASLTRPEVFARPDDAEDIVKSFDHEI